jgi:hypothetical protein
MITNFRARSEVNVRHSPAERAQQLVKTLKVTTEKAGNPPGQKAVGIKCIAIAISVHVYSKWLKYLVSYLVPQTGQGLKKTI